MRAAFGASDLLSEDELAMVDDAGPLTGWQLQVSALILSLSAVGFAEQARLTLRECGKTTIDALRAAEPDDPRLGSVPACRRQARAADAPIRSATICATSVGVVPTATPHASRASFLAWAVPDEPEMIAPA